MKELFTLLDSQTSDSSQVARDILLPALRSCACCADPSVRLTTSNIFQCLIGCLSQRPSEDVTSTSSSTALTLHTRTHSGSGKPVPTTSSLLSECWQLASQLARDDYAAIGTVVNLLASSVATEEELDTESADLACIAVALGPLFYLYSRLIRPTVYVTDTDLKRRKLFESSQIADQVRFGEYFLLFSIIDFFGECFLYL